MSQEPEPAQPSSGALRASEAMGSIVHAAPVGVHLYELTPDDRLVLLAFNPAAETLLGVDHSQLRGRCVEDVFGDAAAHDAGHGFLRVAREGGIWECDELVSGGPRVSAGIWQVSAFSPAASRVAVLFRDATDRFRREASTKLAELRYERFRSVITDGYAFCRVLFDEAGTPVDWVVLDANDYIRPPVRGADLIGKRSHEVAPDIEASPPGFFRACLRAGVSGAPQELEYRRVLGGWTRFTITCPQDGHFAILATDITELKRLQLGCEQASTP